MITAHLLDMDGVLVRGGQAVVGSVDYVATLIETGQLFQVFTNNSRFAPEDHAERLRAVGFPLKPEHIYTSALATARFVQQQKPGSSVYVVGGHGLVEALQRVGCRMTEFEPDFVILGDTTSYHYEQIVTGANLVGRGASFLATNQDATCPTESGFRPACGAVAALIEKSTGRRPYFVGKPNPFMMRGALERLGTRAADTILVGDRMDTDVASGVESGLKTALVLTGETSRADIERFPFRPDYVVERLVDLGQAIVDQLHFSSQRRESARDCHLPG